MAGSGVALLAERRVAAGLGAMALLTQRLELALIEEGRVRVAQVAPVVHLRGGALAAAFAGRSLAPDLRADPAPARGVVAAERRAAPAGAPVPFAAARPVEDDLAAARLGA